MLGLRYTSVNFGAEKSPSSPTIKQPERELGLMAQPARSRGAPATSAQKLVFYCRTTSASAAPCTNKRTTLRVVLATVTRASRCCEHFPDRLDLLLLPPALTVGANRLFQGPHLHHRPMKSDYLQYKSRGLKYSICSRYERRWRTHQETPRGDVVAQRALPLMPREPSP